MKLIQVSDLHFVPPGTRLFGLDPQARLAACIEDIHRRHGDAELCIFTGDLADRGAPEAYQALKETLATLRLPWRLLIGNHDDRAAFKAAFPAVPTDDQGFVQSVLSTDEGEFILLDTHEPGTAEGRFCAARQAWLREQLATAGQRPVYLFAHHPPFDIGIPSLDRIRLKEEAGLLSVLKTAGDLRHFFFGHVHRPLSGCWQGLPFSALRSLVHQVPLDFDTPAPVPYDRDPPHYAVLLIDKDKVVVHHHEFLEDRRLPADTPRYSTVA